MNLELERSVLLVDDDTFLLNAMARQLRLFLLEHGYAFYICDSISSYQKLAASGIVKTCDLAIVDLWMIDKSSNTPDRRAGLEVMRQIRKEQPDCYLVVYTAHLNEEARPDLDEMSELAIIEKPAATAEITDVITKVLDLELEPGPLA
jgi:DNA-binding NtrC family response regulator